MKIVSFTMVNNESEIIESFIRYNYNFVDEMVIIDNGCTDNTMQIIQNLIREGYKIIVYDESLKAYDQFWLDNKYLRKIIDEIQPDLILPMDADEFVTADKNPREMLESLNLNKIYYIHWQWYVMSEEDSMDEIFIPKRLKYCFEKPVWNYSDKTVVTKAIIPARYFDEMHLTLSMGHHTVFGNDKVIIEKISYIRFAHYRVVSLLQFISKTYCYTMRDIATMGNNSETAQRTNQLFLIEYGKNIKHAVFEASYGGYTGIIRKQPIPLQYCKEESLVMKYGNLSMENLDSKVCKTGQEMAIRAYNSERKKKEKCFIKPIVVYLDGVKGKECIQPDPSNHITIMASMYNIRAYLSINQEVRFLKANYRLIITPDWIKFLPYKYIVIPNTVDFQNIKKQLISRGIVSEKIISEIEYKKKLGIIGMTYCYIRFIPSMIERIRQYIKRNGISGTIDKIKQRLQK